MRAAALIGERGGREGVVNGGAAGQRRLGLGRAAARGERGVRIERRGRRADEAAIRIRQAHGESDAHGGVFSEEIAALRRAGAVPRRLLAVGKCDRGIMYRNTAILAVPAGGRPDRVGFCGQDDHNPAPAGRPCSVRRFGARYMIPRSHPCGSSRKSSAMDPLAANGEAADIEDAASVIGRAVFHDGAAAHGGGGEVEHRAAVAAGAVAGDGAAVEQEHGASGVFDRAGAIRRVIRGDRAAIQGERPLVFEGRRRGCRCRRGKSSHGR